MENESLDVPRRRRRFDPAFKRAVVEQTLDPGASVAGIALQHGINANLLFKWRRQMLQPCTRPSDGPSSPSVSLLPVTVIDQEPATPAPIVRGTSAPGRIEITLTGGSIRVEGAVDPGTLQLVLASLRR